MKVAIISDIHGNMSALQAVLPELEDMEMIICCGDMVGYYPDVNEVCTAVRDLNAHTIRGNHDAFISGILQPEIDKASIYRTDWMISHLTKDHLSWLTSLPEQIDLCIDNLTLTIRHASPWDETTYIYPDSDCLKKIFLDNNQILILGHTHRPMKIQAGQGYVINPGSIGQPRDWNPRSSFAILDTKTQEIEFIRKSYNVVNFQKRLNAMGWSNVTEILYREKIN